MMNRTPWHVVIVSGDLEHRRGLTAILMNLGLDPICASRVSHCRELLKSDGVGLIFCDQFLEDGDYRDVTVASRSAQNEPCVVLTLASPDAAGEESMRREVFGVVRVPHRPTEVEWMVIQARRNHSKKAGTNAAATAMVHPLPNQGISRPTLPLSIGRAS